MTSRPTTEFTTAGGHVIVMYTYATGGEYEQIQQCYLEGAKIEFDDGTPRVTGLDAAGAERKANDTMLKMLIVSIDGSTENVAQTAKDLPKDEYLELVAKLNECTGKKVAAVSEQA